MADPECFFDIPQYTACGALFWPDYWKTPADNPIWKIMDVAFVPTHEQESGQMVINKERCWKALNLCLFLNRSGDVYYKLLFGDKDTFRFAWMALGCDYFMITKEPASCGYIDDNNSYKGITMLQYDYAGAPFFLHRNLVKWDVTDEKRTLWNKIKRFNSPSAKNSYISGYSPAKKHYYIDLFGPYEEIDCTESFENIESKCLACLAELRKEKFYLDLLVHEYLIKGGFK